MSSSERDSEVLCKLTELKISFETSKLLSNPLLSKTSIFINCQTLQRQVLNLPKQIIMKLFGLSAPEPGTKKLINLQIVENEQSFWLGTETEHTKHWALSKLGTEAEQQWQVATANQSFALGGFTDGSWGRQPMVSFPPLTSRTGIEEASNANDKHLF